jgi:hypothetical protein
MLGPIAVGHWASNAAIGIAAENGVEDHRPGVYLTNAPTHYCNHPWAFWTTTSSWSGSPDVACAPSS